MEHKKSKLTLKGIDESTGIPFIKEIHSLDEVKTSGTYIVIARNATSEENGFPKIHGKTDCCFCCEANLVVNCCYNDDESQSSNTYGQELTISDKENNTTGTYKRTVGPAGCSDWLMVATGNIELIAQNNDIVKAYNEVSANYIAAVERIDKAEDTVLKSHNTILESATVRFDRIEENEVTINSGEIDNTPTAIVYYKPANKFVAADSAGNYWDTWEGMKAYMGGGTVRKDKVYLCGDDAYISRNGNLKKIFDKSILSCVTDISKPKLTEGIYYPLIYDKAPTKPISLNSWGALACEVNIGDIITITTVGGGNARAYALTDKDRNILSSANADSTLTDFTITAEQDGYLYINCKAANFDTFKVEIIKSTKALYNKYDKAVSSVATISHVCGFPLNARVYRDLTGDTPTNLYENANYLASDEIPVKTGESYLLTTTGGLNARAYAFTNEDRTIVEVAESNIILERQIITAPTDGYLFVNCTADGYATFSLIKNYISEDICNLHRKLKQTNAELIKTEVYTVSNATNSYYNLSKNIGDTAPASSYTHDSWYSFSIPIAAGSTITITAVGGGNARAYALTDNNRRIVSLADADSTLVDFQITAEQDGYLYINCKAENSDILKISTSIKRFDRIEDEIRALGNVLENERLLVPMMYNPAVNFQKQSLKVLDIGNSYTVDATHYLSNIINAAGADNIDMSLYSAIRSSGSYKSWYNCYKDLDNLSYSVGKVYGETIDGIAGSGAANDGSVFRNALVSAKWDVIIIHQVSNYANDYSHWEKNGDGGYLKELIQILRKTNPQATIGFLLVHSYRGSFGNNTEGDSSLRWQNIVNATKELKQNYGIDFIVPYGTAVQNLRASSLSDANEFSTDGTHLADGLGDYVAACCYYQSLIAPRTGISVLGNTFRETNLDESVAGVKNITDDTVIIAQKAAMLATYNMWSVMNPDEYEL
ncbi:MAG: DUF4886 domain-containing protein [Bacteroidaceae bacterium]|nr:DUF4886 domain-containing protein [Bacteroidaceae bacterium]